MNNRELVRKVEANYAEVATEFPIFFDIFFYAFKYSLARSGADNARRAFSRLQRSIRSRSLYKKNYIYNPLLHNLSGRGIVELNEFGDRFADLKHSVSSAVKRNKLKLVINNVSKKSKLRGQFDVLSGRTFSFEHLLFSTPDLQQLLTVFANYGLTSDHVRDKSLISKIESILISELNWLKGELAKRNVKAIFLSDDQRPAAALLCRASREVGVSTVTVRHGYTGWSQAYSSSLPLKSDHFIVWSDFEAHRIHELYPEYRKRVHSFGFPGLEKPLDELRLQPLASDDRKILTYICGPIWFMKEKFDEDVLAFLSGVRHAVEAAGYEFVLRLHWKDRQRSPTAEVLQIMTEFQTSDGELSSDFQRSMVIAASYVSSVLLEASACGRWAINITDGGFEVPWADNVALGALSAHLMNGECLATEPSNAFRSGEFESFLSGIFA